MAVTVSTAQETIVQDTTKSLLFKLFPIEEGMSGNYEKGYENFTTPLILFPWNYVMDLAIMQAGDF